MSAATVERRVVATCMEEVVGETLRTISELPSPVVRSGHVGNNTSNIWGWLALAGNARLGLVDHNLYGVDEVCLPWLVLGDGGRVEAAFDLDGKPWPEVVGKHATAARERVPRKHWSHLALGLGARHEGRDLMAHHFRVADRLSRRMNGSRASTDAFEILELREDLRALARDLHRERRLDAVFDRWVIATRRGRLSQQHVGEISYRPGGDLALSARDGRRLFAGPVDDLLDRLFEAAGAVSRRLASEGSEAVPEHPWITSAFGYVLYTLGELRRDPGRERFWHGGGSTSQYYVNDPEVLAEHDRLRELLSALGHLPARWHLRIVPTYPCQLFATDDASLERLDALHDAWNGAVAAHRAAADRTVGELGATTDPLPSVRRFTEALGERWRGELRRRLAELNALDVNVLPVAHALGHDSPTYNKYGVAQHRLLGRRPRFSDALRDLRWGEAELLVKVLAELDAGRLG